MPLADPFPAQPEPLAGARWAAILGGALLAGFALLTGGRLLPGGGRETVLQQPVSPADFPTDHPALTAPDPGDNP